jgi:hypothetical protein
MKDNILQKEELHTKGFVTSTGHCEDVPQS